MFVVKWSVVALLSLMDINNGATDDGQTNDLLVLDSDLQECLGGGQDKFTQKSWNWYWWQADKTSTATLLLKWRVKLSQVDA